MTQKMIDPKRVQLDTAGICTRSWFVRMGEGMVGDDARDPKIWARVQQTRDKVLRKHDKVYLVGHGEDFAIEARVVAADAQSATLALQKIIAVPARAQPLFADDRYQVEWDGAGYVVIRRNDGQRMGQTWGSEALAVRYLGSLYPQPTVAP